MALSGVLSVGSSFRLNRYGPLVPNGGGLFPGSFQSHWPLEGFDTIFQSLSLERPMGQQDAILIYEARHNKKVRTNTVPTIYLLPFSKHLAIHNNNSGIKMTVRSMLAQFQTCFEFLYHQPHL